MNAENPVEPDPTGGEVAGQPTADSAPIDRWRLSIVLIVVASVIAILTAVNTWVERQLLETDEWVELSDELLANDEVRHALAVYLVDQLYESVNVNTELGDRLPEQLDPLAGLVAGALRAPLTDGVDRLLESDAVQDVWHRVNREAHTRAVALLREEEVAGLSTAGGEIAIELAELVREVGALVGIAEERLDRIPDDAGRIVIVGSDGLATAQNTVFMIELLSAPMFVLIVALYALAVYAAGSRRRDALFWVGISLVTGGLLVLVGRRFGLQSAASAVADLPDRRAVASIVADLTTDLLFEMAVAGIVYGLLIAGGAKLFGSSPIAVRVRRLLTPLLAAGPVLAVLTAGVTLLVVLAFVPGGAFESPWRGLVSVALYAVGVVAIRRELQRESAQPDEAPTATADR